MTKRLYCIRGAVCADNTKESIKDSVCKMMNLIVELNNLKTEDIVSFQFTMTPDLDELNPATALRTGNCKVDSSVIPLFCSAEPVIKGMLKRVIRVMVSVYLEEGSVIKPVYTNGAEALRPDIAK